MPSILDIQKKYSSKLDHLDLDLLISAIIKQPREYVLAHPEYKITMAQNLKLKPFIQRRLKGEPIAYMLEHKDFYGLDFKVNKHVLIPRPETEQIVELAIQSAKHKAKNLTIIDVGTGSGNIIISVVKNLESFTLRASRFTFYGLDISKDALKIAKQNAKTHKVDKNITFLQGNLLEPVLKNSLPLNKQHSELIILANLPYLDIGWKNLLKSTETKGLKFEPHIALYAGKDGLDAYRKLTDQLKLLSNQTKNKITLFCEIGHLQVRGMQKIFSFAKNIKFEKDLANKWRVCKIEL